MGAVPGGFPRVWGPHRLLIPPWPSTLPPTLGVNLSSCLVPPGGGPTRALPSVGLSGSPPPLPATCWSWGAPLCVSIEESHPSCFKTLGLFPLRAFPGCGGVAHAEVALWGSPKSTAPNVSPTSLGAQKPGRWTWSGGALSSCRLGHPGAHPIRPAGTGLLIRPWLILVKSRKLVCVYGLCPHRSASCPPSPRTPEGDSRPAARGA